MRFFQKKIKSEIWKCVDIAQRGLHWLKAFYITSAFKQLWLTKILVRACHQTDYYSIEELRPNFSMVTVCVRYKYLSITPFFFAGSFTYSQTFRSFDSQTKAHNFSKYISTYSLSRANRSGICLAWLHFICSSFLLRCVHTLTYRSCKRP